MQVYKFTHDDPVKASCCNWETSQTFIMAESREEAEQKIKELTEDNKEPHGNCGDCLADLLAEVDYEVKKNE